LGDALYINKGLASVQTPLSMSCNASPPPPQSQDSALGQKGEEGRQLKQDLQRVQSLFTSAERELRYEREKNTDLKRHNLLLEQEKLKVAEMEMEIKATWMSAFTHTHTHMCCVCVCLSWEHVGQ